MVQEKTLYIEDMGKTRVTGFRSTFTKYPLRTFKAKPNGVVNPNHRVFRWLSVELQIMGYTMKIDEKGWITIDMPYSDRYAVVLRKIAWAYYVALYKDTDPMQQTLTQEAT